jgi:predicted PurR-regulated permease PerM
MTPSVPERGRLAWWLFVLGLGAFLAFVAYSLVGALVFGLFIYYGVRPLQRFLERRLSPSAAAPLTMLIGALPFFVVAGYFALVGFRELAPQLRNYREYLSPYVDVSALAESPAVTLASMFRNPEGVDIAGILSSGTGYVSVLTQALATFFLAALLAYYLLQDGHRLAAWFRDLSGEDSAAYAYVTAVDNDLELIYASNVALVAFVAVGAQVVYHGYNYLAPNAIGMPFPTVLAVATGLASLIPFVVGKVVYLPLVGYLSWETLQVDPSWLGYPAGLLVVAFLFLDLIPMTFILPELAGRHTHVGLVMFGYVVGTVMFGWYGLFLGPLVVIVCLQAVRIVLEELVRGDPVTGEVTAAEGIGADPDTDAEGE